MFVNALRTQTRLILPVARSPVSVTRALALRATLKSNALRLSRSLSTTSPVARSNEDNSVNFFDRVKLENANVQPITSIFVGNLPFFVTEEELVDLFREYGPTKSTFLGTGPNGRSLGWAIVEFENLDDAVSIVRSAEEEPFHLAGRDVVVSFSKSGPRNLAPCNKLHFRGFDGDLRALQRFLGPHADEVTDAFFLKDKVTRETKHSGFIEFRTVEAATKALEELSNAPNPKGGAVVLRYSTPKRPRKEESSESY